MALSLRRQPAHSDRLTLGLAAIALGTTGAVIGGHVLRMARRRIAEDHAELASASVLETAEHALAATTQATHDSFTVAVEGYSAASQRETVLFNLLAGFSGSLALVRLSTWGIRSGWWPLGNVRLRGRHVHHFVPGILLAFAAGGAGLIAEGDRSQQLLAFPLGAGIAMTFDEAALLLQLEDVYWSREGMLSVQLSLGLAAALGAGILAQRILSQGERQSERAGLIPTE